MQKRGTYRWSYTAAGKCFRDNEIFCIRRIIGVTWMPESARQISTIEIESRCTFKASFIILSLIHYNIEQRQSLRSTPGWEIADFRAPRPRDWRKICDAPTKSLPPALRIFAYSRRLYWRERHRHRRFFRFYRASASRARAFPLSTGGQVPHSLSWRKRNVYLRNKAWYDSGARKRKVTVAKRHALYAIIAGASRYGFISMRLLMILFLASDADDGWLPRMRLLSPRAARAHKLRIYERDIKIFALFTKCAKYVIGAHRPSLTKRPHEHFYVPYHHIYTF